MATLKVRYGILDDLSWLKLNDPHASESWIKRCLNNHEYIVASDAGNLVGFLRFSLFWGVIPYMDMVWLPEEQRGQGIGSELFAFWEKEMKSNGYKTMMTSSMLDELKPQAWHIKNGFMRCGQLTLGQYQQTPEIFLTKDI